MPKHEAVKALEIYRRAGQQVIFTLIPSLIFFFDSFFVLYGIYFSYLLIMEGIGSTSAVLCCFSYQTLVLLQLGAFLNFMMFAKDWNLLGTSNFLFLERYDAITVV